MKRAFTMSLTVIAALLLIAIGCRSGGADLSRVESQRQFGVRMAKMNLWREAMFRFQRAVQIDPDSAMAHNNLAVAYEANGDFDSAAREYREALRLDRGNQYIQKNYSRYVEFTQRSKKREAKPAAGVSTAAPAATTTTAAATPASPAGTTTAPPVETSTAPPPVTDTTTTTTTNPPKGGAR